MYYDTDPVEYDHTKVPLGFPIYTTLPKPDCAIMHSLLVILNVYCMYHTLWASFGVVISCGGIQTESHYVSTRNQHLGGAWFAMSSLASYIPYCSCFLFSTLSHA